MYGSWTENVEKFFRIQFRDIKMFSWCIKTVFERKVDFQNHPFGWLHFENKSFKIIK